MAQVAELRPGRAGLLPPQDLDAEAAVLSAILLVPERLDDVREIIVADCFYSDSNRRIFAAMLELDRESKPVDIVTVMSRLRDRNELSQIGGSVYLHQLVDATPAVGHIHAHALVVRDKSRLRRMIERCQRHAAEGYGDVGELQPWLENVEASVAEIAHSGDPGALESLTPILDRTHSYLRAVARKDPSTIGAQTGFLDLDEKIAGMHDGDLHLVAGRPGSGKTAAMLGMVLGIASQQAEGARRACAIFSLEMPKVQLGIRLLCAEARVPLSLARKGRLGEQGWTALADAMARMASWPIYVDDTPAITLAEVRSRVRRLAPELRRRGERLALVGVDYLQLVTPRSTDRISREQQVAEMSRECKVMAKQLDVPLLVNAQLNRAVEQRAKGDKRPQLSDLRESGALEQDADVAMFVYRDELYNRDSEDKGIAEIIIGKQRNGPTGTVKMRFTPEYTRFDNLAHDEWGDDWDEPS